MNNLSEGIFDVWEYIKKHKSTLLYGSGIYLGLSTMTSLLKGFLSENMKYAPILQPIIEHPKLAKIAGTVLVALGFKWLAKKFSKYVQENITGDVGEEIDNVKQNVSMLKNDIRYGEDDSQVDKNFLETLKSAAGAIGRISDNIAHNIEKKREKSSDKDVTINKNNI